MNWLRNTVSVLGASVVCGLVAPGCQDNESMLFIIGVLAVETTNCVAKAERGATFRAAGTLDTTLSLGNGYRAPLLVGSQLTPRGSREQLRTETARLILKGAEVTLLNAREELLPISPNPFATVGTGFVDPASGTEPGLAGIFVDVIPASVTAAVSGALGGDGLVIARVRVYGTTLGGQDVESGEYSYPIHVCSGCLVNYPISSIQPGTNGNPECAQQMNTAGAATSDVCYQGQDQATNCGFCAGALAACLNPCANCSVIRADANMALCPAGHMATCSP